MEKDTLYVGLDVHAETITVAVAEEGRAGEVRSLDRCLLGLFSQASTQALESGGHQVRLLPGDPFLGGRFSGKSLGRLGLLRRTIGKTYCHRFRLT